MRAIVKAVQLQIFQATNIVKIRRTEKWKVLLKTMTFILLNSKPQPAENMTSC